MLSIHLLQSPPGWLGVQVRTAAVDMDGFEGEGQASVWALLRLMVNLQQLGLTFSRRARCTSEDVQVLPFLPKLELVLLTESDNGLRTTCGAAVPAQSTYLSQVLGKPCSPVVVRADLFSSAAIGYIASLGELVSELWIRGYNATYVYASPSLRTDWQAALRSLTSLRRVGLDVWVGCADVLKALPSSVEGIVVGLSHEELKTALVLFSDPSWLPALKMTPKYFAVAIERAHRYARFWPEVDLARLDSLMASVPRGAEQASAGEVEREGTLGSEALSCCLGNYRVLPRIEVIVGGVRGCPK